MKAIYFDMDGTIANFYAVGGWLAALQRRDTYPYDIAQPIYSKEELEQVILELKRRGYTIGVVSWGSKDHDPDYMKRIRKSKKEWLKKFFPWADEIHIVRHGTPKWKVVKIKDSILIDDEEKNLSDWRWGSTIDARKNIVEALKSL